MASELLQRCGAHAERCAEWYLGTLHGTRESSDVPVHSMQCQSMSENIRPAQAVSALRVPATFPSGALRNDTLHVVVQAHTMAGVTADSLVKDKQRDKVDPSANIELIGSLQVVARRGVLGLVKRLRAVVRCAIGFAHVLNNGSRAMQRHADDSVKERS